MLAGCGRRTAAADPATRETVWAAIQPLAARHHIEPSFVYALVTAESNFDARAHHREARGLLQLKPGVWRKFSLEPYEPTVWDWRRNLETGVRYLGWCRSRLRAQEKFSYPLLAASFHYGIDAVLAADCDLDEFAAPDNPIYRELWRGHLAPVPPPSADAL